MWSPEGLHAALAPGRLDHAAAGFGGRPAARGAPATLSCAEAPGEPAWQRPLEALEGLLRERGRRGRLHVVLSGHFTRWQLLPWRPEVASAGELAAYARIRFREVYGEGARGWHIAVTEQPPGLPLPACAIDRALGEGLERVAAAAGWRLASVRPYFAAAFDGWRGAVKGEPAWFAALEPGRLGLGLLRGGRWAALRSEATGAAPVAALEALIAQTGLGLGIDPGEGSLYVCGADAPWDGLLGAHPVRRLHPAVDWGWPERCARAEG